MNTTPKFFNPDAFAPERDKVRARYERMYVEAQIRKRAPEPSGSRKEIWKIAAYIAAAIVQLAIIYLIAQ